MSIKFVCVCGKRLRAREDMASRRSVCPRCGAPVGIPSTRPTHRGATEVYLQPGERRGRLARLPVAEAIPRTADGTGRLPEPASRSPAGPVPAPRPLDPSVVVALPPKRPERPPLPLPADAWGFETRAYQCFFYPLHAGLPLLGLGLVYALVSAVGMLVLPQILRASDRPLELGGWCWPVLGLVLFLGGYACVGLEGALTTALQGKPPAIRWPGRNARLALGTAWRWFVCLLAGPLLGLLAAVCYWLYCGEPDTLDQVIIAELVSVALGYWLLLLTVVAHRGRLRDAHPLAVGRLLARLGPGAVLAAVVIGCGVFAHGLLALYALARLQLSGTNALVLIGCWISLFVWAAAAFRWFGWWCHHRLA